jgi:hypothetical protein
MTYGGYFWQGIFGSHIYWFSNPTASGYLNTRQIELFSDVPDGADVPGFSQFLGTLCIVMFIATSESKPPINFANSKTPLRLIRNNISTLVYKEQKRFRVKDLYEVIIYALLHEQWTVISALLNGRTYQCKRCAIQRIYYCFQQERQWFTWLRPRDRPPSLHDVTCNDLETYCMTYWKTCLSVVEWSKPNFHNLLYTCSKTYLK